MKREQKRVELVLLADLPSHNIWGVHVLSGEPEQGKYCVCEQTGGVFQVGIAGEVDAKATVEGKRILRFYSVAGSPHLESGFRMIDYDPMRGSEIRH